MLVDEQWDHVSDESWSSFAASWLHQERTGESPDELDYCEIVIMMNFSARPEQQWKFILAAARHADSDDDLRLIAAGPVEHLLGHHGEQYIGAVEAEAGKHPEFARMLTGVWKHMMPDHVWSRVQSIQAEVAEPL